MGVHGAGSGEDREPKLTGKVWGVCQSVELRELGRGLCIYSGGRWGKVWGWESSALGGRAEPNPDSSRENVKLFCGFVIHTHTHHFV